MSKERNFWLTLVETPESKTKAAAQEGTTIPEILMRTSLGSTRLAGVEGLFMFLADWPEVRCFAMTREEQRS